MKKTLNRKLSLRRETLRALESLHLAGVAAGRTEASCNASCVTNTYVTCFTETCASETCTADCTQTEYCTNCAC